MIIELTDTTASDVAAALVQARRHAGSPTMGMVLTLVIVADEDTQYDAMKAATLAAKEHPSRLVGVISRGGRGHARVDAEVRVGGEAGPGESVLLRLYGQLAKFPESVVSPLLLPESPVVVWWPGRAPDTPSESSLGQLAQRRVTDSAADRRPLRALLDKCTTHAPGDTDLTWTRVTPWRALLAAALDQDHAEVNGATVEAERANASADLLAAWLSDRLRVQVDTVASKGPGITAARLHTTAGDIAITRPDGRLARYEVPGQPHRHVALPRRDTSQLLAEELRWLDPDATYGTTVGTLLRRDEARQTGRTNRSSAKTSSAKRPSTKQTGAQPTSSKQDATKKAQRRSTKRSDTGRGAATKRSSTQQGTKQNSSNTAKKATTKSTSKKSARTSTAKRSR